MIITPESVASSINTSIVPPALKSIAILSPPEILLSSQSSPSASTSTNTTNSIEVSYVVNSYTAYPLTSSPNDIIASPGFHPWKLPARPMSA